jgi:hypothetical protein
LCDGGEAYNPECFVPDKSFSIFELKARAFSSGAHAESIGNDRNINGNNVFSSLME